MSAKTVKIGGASGFWGDAARATPQLLASQQLDYIVYDYLAEITMSIMARARAKEADKGYALDFVSVAMGANLKEIAGQGVKVISNAGGVNPQACAQALRGLISKMGLDLRVACVLGDDLIERRQELAGQGYREMFSGADFPAPDRLQSVNAYLGAFPIAKALEMGADIVITGRSVDSAVTLGACIHAFGWGSEDLDQLAMGSLAGHILECGPQATGGNFTDWEQVADQLEDIGYPIAEVSADGSFICTKPEGTAGLVSRGTVAEQMVYEIGDPQAYLLPDVSCDFSHVTIEEIGADRVLVKGATGRAAPHNYKVCATYADEFRGGTYLTVYGIDAEKKARALGEATFRAARRTLQALGLADFSETSMELIGDESQYGEFRALQGSREVAMKIAVKHPDPKGIGILLKEATGLGLATPPGLSGFQGGRPKPSPVVRLFSFELAQELVPVSIDLDGELSSFEPSRHSLPGAEIIRPVVPEALPTNNMLDVPLVRLAWGRSGDKGDKANIGIIARHAEFYPYILTALTEAVVAKRFAHFLKSAEPGRNGVERFLMPGVHGVNFLLHSALGGGGIASIRNDPQGKGYAQLLLEVPVSIPAKLLQDS